jgi:hypothetical protein
MYLFDTLTGNAEGQLPEGTFGRPAFNAAASKLAVVTPGRLTIIDLAKGESTSDIALPPKAGLVPQWLGEDFIVLDGENLVSLQKGAPVARLAMPPRAAKLNVGEPDRLWFTVPAPQGKNLVLTGAVPSRDSLTQPIAKLKDEDLFAAAPGSAVSLEVNIDAPQDIKDSVTDALTKKLEANQMKVSAGAAVKLVASTEQQKPQEKTYRGFGGKRETITDVPTVLWLRFVVNDKTAWETSTLSAASFIYHGGDSIQSQVNEGKMRAFDFYKKVWLPAKVPAPIELDKLATIPVN